MLNRDDLQEIIRARLSRTKIYLEHYRNALPNHYSNLKNLLAHPISELHILIQYLSNQPYRCNLPFYPLSKGRIPADVSYFELALNEIKTALIYFQQRTIVDLFKEISDFHLEQKVLKVISALEGIKLQIP
ncbi:MAG: hypothetical protein ACTSRC_04895 [Candidatus Helarchaeota archaeon]